MSSAELHEILFLKAQALMDLGTNEEMSALLGNSISHISEIPQLYFT